jgi:hypothetical protein
MVMHKSEVLDDFEDLSVWSTLASGLATLEISRDAGVRGTAMRLDFDFKGGGGFVVARKELSLELPERYSFCFQVRGVSPANKLEFKLIDSSGLNAWWYRDDAFDFTDDWRAMRIRSSQIEFAWGPAGGGPPSRLGALELVLAAGLGGKGTVWIDDLVLIDESYRAIPKLRASSSAPGHEPEKALDDSSATSWRNEPLDTAPWLVVDFGEEREYGGVILRWEPQRRARKFRLLTSNDGHVWKTAHVAPCAGRRPRPPAHSPLTSILGTTRCIQTSDATRNAPAATAIHAKYRILSNSITARASMAMAMNAPIAGTCHGLPSITER